MCGDAGLHGAVGLLRGHRDGGWLSDRRELILERERSGRADPRGRHWRKVERNNANEVCGEHRLAAIGARPCLGNVTPALGATAGIVEQRP